MDSGDKSTHVPDRVRYLNIVYFIESARSHTMRINLRHAKWGLAGAFILFAWSIGSIIWIASLKREVDGTRRNLESALTAVFDYQIKNDKVFELAYPIDATNSYYSEAAQLASNNPIADHQTQPTAKQPSIKIASDTSPQQPTNMKDTSTAQAPTSPSVAAASPPSPAAPTATSPAAVPTPVNHTQPQPQGTDLTNKSKSAKDPSTSKIIGISAPKISKTGSRMTLEFSITNAHSKKAEGYIWAIASIQTAAGQTTRIIAPDHAKLDDKTGQITAVKAAYRFSIQRFKEKSFDFTIPPGLKDWKLTKLTVSFTDLNANGADQVELPVESLAVNQASDTPPTELKL
jgi:hypothetical protein